MIVSVENISKLTSAREVSTEEIESLLKQNPKWGFLLDVCHAATYSIERIKNYINKFNNKIKEIHLSYYKDKVEHLPVHQCDKKFFDAIKPIKNLNAPIVIETHSPKKRLDIYQKDIEFIREYLVNINSK